ncbi:uncharacterized protein LOC132560432 [Ylistrum balloti]|uniref:uncharacterized protein LOC132560432 n=1 Tax=Ylistrum balloti TaxID=509963 RepID=UPI002905CA70|nr:uncharacterized protein LOC132560432 [Ylistrum balloti]
MESNISNIKQELRIHSEKLEGADLDHTILEERISKVESERDRLWEECDYQREKIIELQTRSMKDNLLIGGIPETNEATDDPEALLKNFIKTELGVENDINFQLVHRIRRRSDGKPRSMIAKFTSRKDRDMVLNAAPVKLVGKPQFTVNEQYPPEVNERRRILYPVFKEARRRGQTARMKVDKLYIDGYLYNPPTHDPSRNDGPRDRFGDHSRSQDQRWTSQPPNRHNYHGPPAPPSGHQHDSQ